MANDNAASNAAQIDYWNGEGGERWASWQARIDAQLAAIFDALMAFAAPQRGERVVDIGCGFATTAIELHRRTGAPVVGIDVSRPMLALARTRVPPAVTLVEADASTYEFSSQFDLLFSRFGVMFFADPVAAFAHLRGVLAPGGRLAFVCWRALDDNPWAAVPIAAAKPLVPPQPAMDPHAPGPFAFADRARLEDILARAGWRDIDVRPHDATMPIGATVDDAADEAMTFGPLVRLIKEVDVETRAKIRDRVRAALERFAGAGGVAPPTATWLVGAR